MREATEKLIKIHHKCPVLYEPLGTIKASQVVVLNEDM